MKEHKQEDRESRGFCYRSRGTTIPSIDWAVELQLPASNGMMTLLAGNPQNAAAYLQPLYSGPTHTLKIYHISILLSLILLEESILGSFSKDCHLSKCPCQTQSSGCLCTLAAVLQISSMYNWERSRYSEQRGELSA